MKARNVFLLFLLFAISFSLTAQKPAKPATKQLNSSATQQLTNSPVHQFTSYDRDWKKVDSLSNLGLPKSALEIVDNIYLKAKNENNAPQYIKSIIYRLKLKADFRENPQVASINDVRNELRGTAREPVAQILSSILAELYWNYYQTNIYRFSNRTQLANSIPDSIETWDLKTLSRNIARTYLLSLDNPSLLQSIPIGNFEPILEKPDTYEHKRAKLKGILADEYRPTLYDFLCWRALDYFQGNKGADVSFAEPFVLANPEYFMQASDFARMKPWLPANSPSSDALALKIFQDLASFHLADKDPRALIDEELHRFMFVYENAVMDGKDSLYFESLKKLEEANASSPFSADVTFRIAQYLHDQGSSYHPLQSTKHKWEIKEALGYCEKAIRQFPESTGAVNCRLLASEIRKPALLVHTEYGVIPGKPSLGSLEFRNVEKIWFRLAKTTPEENQERTANRTREELIAYYTGLKFQKDGSLNLPNDGDLQSHRMDFRIPELDAGFYILIVSSDPQFSDTGQVIAWAPFFSTRISYISQKNEKNEEEFYILGRETGLSLKGVVAEAFTNGFNYMTRKYENKKTGEYISDENGHIVLPALPRNTAYGNIFLRLRMKDDLFITGNYYQYPVNDAVKKPVQKTVFFTDRAIYRPGQIIYFKGVLLEKNGDNYSIQPDKTTIVVFTDVNSQKIAEQSLKTNEFGSFNGSFTVPQGVLLGSMTISNGSGSTSISVEEYKRPTFEIAFEPVEGNYRLNDTITMTGKAVAYAGNSLDGASVKYRVVRAARFPFREWWWYFTPPSSETEILHGTMKSASDGSFSIKFRAIPDQAIEKSFNPVFDYVVYADVTDVNGETQSANESVSVGYVSLLVSMNLPEKLDPAHDTAFRLTATNLNGRKTPAVVTVTIQRLHQPDRLLRKRTLDRPDLMGMTEEEFRSSFPMDVRDDEDNPGKWAVEENILQTGFDTKTDSVFRLSTGRLAQGTGLKQGNYLLTMKAKDPYGEAVEVKKDFVIYDPASTKVPVPEMDWFVPLKVSGEPGEKARFLIGTKAENVSVLFEVRRDDSLYSRKHINLNNSQTLVEVPILEKLRGNFAVNFVFIRHNRVFQHSQPVYVPYTNKKLDIKFETFRDKLIPGQNEEWKIKITNVQKIPVRAEYLTAMYDASLDVFRPNAWSFSIFRLYYSSLPWEAGNGFRTSSGTYYPLHYRSDEYIFPVYEQLNWFDMGFLGGGRYRTYRVGGMATDRNAKFAPPMAVADNLTVEESATTEAEMVVPASGQTVAQAGDQGILPTEAGRKEGSQKGIQVRRDFRETAFFYPSLVTDTAGNLEVKFTVPESLTRWKILGFAQTKQLDYGLIENELVTRKDLMVFPNAPRFVRQGDTVVFSTKVVNLSDRTLKGEVRLEMLDALTQKPVSLITGSRDQEFTIPVGQSSSVSWKLAIPDDPALSVLMYRVTARAGDFSDGEENAFPVLTNRMLVTESLPLPVRGKGTFDFKFDKLLNSSSGSTLKNYKLTLEFTSNPAWFAVQALPSLDDPKYPNADNIFRSYYVNSIASFIANSNPRIRQVFESWKNITPDALKSNLGKNEQLKSALLQETPWVLEATDETQRKYKLGLFFDGNTMTVRLDANLKKLQKMQAPSGGWPWFDGMPESRYITQDIVTGIGRLGHLGIKNIREDRETWKMVTKAIGFLDAEIVKDYNDIKKYYPGKLDENHLGATEIQYLFARSYFLRDLPVGSLTGTGPAKEAFDYFRHQAEKYWLQSDLHFQGMIGLALNRMGNTVVPAAILKSLSEKALHSQEMGMYWALQGGYLWYQAPIETQALLIEAYEEISADKKPVDEMKIWLLKQKQTQDWQTGRATAEACYALLLRGTDLLSQESAVKISLGDEVIDPQKITDTKVEAGTGYFQVHRDGKEIRPEMGNVKVDRTGEGVAWGALYWQYFEDLDKITPHSTPLKVEKELFIERVTPAGKVLDPITKYKVQSTNAEGLTVGDKIIVRIVLSVDRNLEFVHMKDMRASAFEPLTSEQNSGYRYQGGLGYYQSMTDLAANFFFDYLPKGTYVFEYPLVINAAGEYSNGITTVQCMYAPEFAAHSEGIRVTIK
ncbi:MAG: MG2 domain-containing protein [Bacteroidetes bacterium]|nr:MG2 domain-containing protein [Bacteroidota bacterium]